MHFGKLGAFCVGSTFQNERFSNTPNTAMYTFAILRNCMRSRRALESRPQMASIHRNEAPLDESRQPSVGDVSQPPGHKLNDPPSAGGHPGGCIARSRHRKRDALKAASPHEIGARACIICACVPAGERVHDMGLRM